MEIAERVKEKMSPAMRRLADHLEKSSEERLLRLTVTELSREAKVSEATVLRFCRLLGFKGYYDFRVTLAREGEDCLREEEEDFAAKLQAEYLGAFGKCREKLSAAALKAAISLVRSAERVCCFSSSQHAVAALSLKNRLLEMGVFAVREEDAQFRNILIPACGEGDLLITLGGGAEAARAEALARANGVKILSLGGDGKLADCALAAEGELALLFLTDILCEGVRRADPERFGRALAKSSCALVGDKV